MKIGFYVGSFNPVHSGHIKIVRQALENYLDLVIIVPTGCYWSKRNLISLKHRIAMLKFYQNEKILIDTTHNQLPYTYMILRELKKKYPRDFLYLMLGADNLVQFQKWKNYQELLNYPFLIVNRNCVDVNYYIKKLSIPKYVIMNVTNIDFSSTIIRKKLVQQENVDHYLDKEVLQYINKYHLFSNKKI